VRNALAAKPAKPAVHGRPSTPPRRERRKLEVRKRIVDAAIELFDQSGFAATKVSDICERADVVNKTFFNHFPTKQHLLREIAEAQISILFEDIRLARDSNGNTRARLLWFFERIANNIDAAGPMRRELVTEIILATQASSEGSVQSQRMQEAFAGLIRAGRDAGDVSDTHPLATQTELVLGAFYALMFGWGHVESYPLRRRALAAARLLGDALCGPEGRSRT
jgi:AcrR family transcriptional regulator